MRGIACATAQALARAEARVVVSRRREEKVTKQSLLSRKQVAPLRSSRLTSALYREGDGYYGIATDSTALHVAARRACHDVPHRHVSGTGGECERCDRNESRQTPQKQHNARSRHRAERPRPDSTEESGPRPQSCSAPEAMQEVDGGRQGSARRIPLDRPARRR
jgi:hypothetical protein